MPKCVASRKRDGEPCTQWALNGIDKCRQHAGISAADRAVRKAVATYGAPRDITPAAALVEEVRYAAGHVAWLRGKVAELEPEALTWGVSEIAHKSATEFGGTDTTERAALNVWLEAYHRERRYLLDVSKAALAAGVEERLVQLAEAQGMAVVTVLARVFDRLQLTDAQRELAAVAVPEELRAQSAV
jgi:DNA-binding TFAR19-related protein (PDSD5 family)